MKTNRTPTHYRVNQIANTPKSDGLIPVSVSTIWRWVAAGDFPKPVKLSPRTTAWRASDVHAWLESRKEAAQ
tara:strand:- start:44255 stop:44470 length:216 start_codon:yes stop_codon:yes gene_type:complete